MQPAQVRFGVPIHPMTPPEDNPENLPPQEAAWTPMPWRQVALNNVPEFGPQPTMRVEEEINLDNSEDSHYDQPDNGNLDLNNNDEGSDDDYSIGELTNRQFLE